MTTVYPQAWERTLLPLAYEAEHQGVAPTPMPVSDPALLDRAFMHNTPVKQIEVDGNRATGVILQDGSFLGADVIVANADLPYVYAHLLPDRAEAHRLEGLQYTCSAIMFYWAVDRVYPQLFTHNVFLAGDYRASDETSPRPLGREGGFNL